MEDEGLSLAVSELSLRYRLSLRFDDPFAVETALTELRSRRCRFDYRILTEGGALVATASTLHTPTNRKGRAVRLPEAWLGALEPLARGG
jgi:acyl-CoA thioesterase FadM